MIRARLENLTTDQLVERFAAIGVEQDKADQAEDDEKYKRLFSQMSEVQNELKSRPGDQRRVLVALFDYPNMQVRLMSAKYALAVAPQAARQAIEAIAASTWVPQCYDARMCLRMLDKGAFVPE
jgi:Domain of unknown function (DUF2019)